MNIKDDEDWNMPYIQTFEKDSTSWHKIPAASRRNIFIVSIDAEEPIEMSTHLLIILLCRWRIHNHDTITSEDYDDDYEDMEKFRLPLLLFERQKFIASRYRKNNSKISPSANGG